MEDKQELKMYFSLISGDLYFVEADEVKNLDKAQIPLIKRPKSNCKKCFGRFHIGFENIRKHYLPCPKCMKKCVDWDAIKDDEIVVETPVTTNTLADHDFITEAEKAGV
jgi:hypothetical protein